MGSYDRARRQQINPNKVRWHQHRLNQDAVEWYRRHPNKTYPKTTSDGDPFVVIGRDGVARGYNGSHRAEAARRSGRKVTARVHDERVSGAVTGGGCLVVMVWLAALSTSVVAAVRGGSGGAAR